MSYNTKYNTRNSGRYNTPGQFVPAGELVPGAPQRPPRQPPLPPPPQPPHHNTFANNHQQYQQMQHAQQAQQQQQQQQQPPLPQQQFGQQRNQNQNQNIQDVENTEDEPMATAEGEEGAGEANGRPHWLKNKLLGVKKISNKERRRRQNATLRKLLTPKNALMVLNEMMPNEQINNQFKVEPATQYAHQYMTHKPGMHTFCADLTVEGKVYKGFGDNKLTARNSAAEQAIADLIIKKMNKVVTAAAATASTADVSAGGESMEAEGGEAEEEALPMIQLASFALHKLFSEWESGGHKVPQLKPAHALSESDVSMSVSGAPAAAEPRPKPKAKSKPKEVPLNASAMHPSMLLTYMRPSLDYRELAVEGDKPQNMIFTMGVEVDGTTYIGKASNKKEARKQAAKSACQALFNVTFDAAPSANAPLVKQEN